ncbi:MAG TPA: pyridoxal-phosphate dependent enzyme [Candidatus Acidoferrum sp.]|nr:pyridoxal-phosphate dependent enzyme [Candidatus Acidoferrum sp.]
MEYYLECTGCRCRYDSGYRKQVCESCGSLLEVEYRGRVRVPDGRGFWDYEKMLPKGKFKHYELGGTELVQSSDYKNLFLKLELQNPTRSFKDRGSVVEVAKAKEYGYREVAIASTGNMAYSLSYYAKMSGIGASVFIGRDTNPNKIRDILMTHDAALHRVDGDFSKAQEVAARYAKTRGAFLAGDFCYRKEGQKTVMYEIAAGLKGITHVIVPVGNATLLSATFKAIMDLKSSRRIRKIPRIVAVQAEGCSPLVKAVKKNAKTRYERPRTGADAIAVGLPTFGEQAIDAIRRTRGTAVAVSEKEMAAEQKRLYDDQGILAELAGVAPIAAFKKLGFKRSDRAVAIVSGGNL